MVIRADTPCITQTAMHAPTVVDRSFHLLMETKRINRSVATATKNFMKAFQRLPA